jgi:hypothetical protein
MALGLSVFGLKHLEFLISKGRMIEIENKSYYPRKNKFKLLSEIPQIEMFDTYIDVPF